MHYCFIAKGVLPYIFLSFSRIGCFIPKCTFVLALKSNELHKEETKINLFTNKPRFNDRSGKRQRNSENTI